MNICDEWENEKGINPLTKKKIKEHGDVYNRINKICNNRELCDKFRNNNKINPITKKQLLDTSDIKYELTRICNNLSGDSSKVKKVIKEPECTYISSPTRCIDYKTITLKDHQIKTCNYLIRMGERLKGLLVYHSVGSGKTITAITMIRCLIKENENRQIFILTPKSLLNNFKKEMIKLKVNFGNKVKMLSYGTFLNDVKYNGTDRYKNAVIVVDEAHNFKGIIGQDKNTKSVMALMSVTKIAEKVILLTATPVTNKIMEFANLFAMITGKEDSVDLRRLYTIFHNADPEIIKRLLKGRVSYFMNDTTEDYPAATYHIKEFEMSEEYYQEYKKIETNQGVGFYSNSGKSLSVFLNGIRRAANVIDYNIVTDKVRWTVKHIINQTRNNKKVLVYSTWIKSGIRILQKYLDKYNIKWVEVTGSMTTNSRDSAVNKYNRDSVKVIFISSAGGEGLDLKGTSSVVIMEPHWHTRRLDQVIGRAIRYKSHSHLPENERHVDVYNLVLRKPEQYRHRERASVDVVLYKLAKKKDNKIQDFYNILKQVSI
jgi:SNF2 family DNA or RNA helicase